MRTRAKIQSWFGSLHPGAQLAIGAGAVYVGYRLIKGIFSTDNSGGTSTSLSCGAQNLSYSVNQYKLAADAIESAVWGTWAIPSITENDSAIGNILMSMQNDDDVCRLNNEYGNRFRGTLFQDGGNLAQTIQAYLDEDVKAAVNADYQSKGINYRFL